MNDREMRELLEEIIDDVDNGRVEVERPHTLRRSGTVLAAAAALGLGVGLAACSGPAKRDVQDPGDNRPRTSQADAGAKKDSVPVDAGAKKKDPSPRPPDAMRPDAPVPAYGVPSPPVNKQPKPPKSPMKIRGGENRPMYGVR